MHPRQSGIGLVELMVALVIGLFLILGALTVMSKSRSTYRTAERIARLQEIGRLAMDVIETDVRLSNYWGMNNQSDYIVNRVPPGGTPPAELTADQQGNAAVCGDEGAANYFALDLDDYVNGSNNAYGLTCAVESDFQGGSDVLWVRRVNSDRPDTLDANSVYVQSSRIRGTLFVPAAGCLDPDDAACLPADYQPPASQTRQLEVHAYYVSSASTNRDDVPALRRKRLANINGAAATDVFVDEEIVAGVEDLQVRLGVDTNGDTNIDQYVNPGAVPAGANVVSATIWLRIRAEEAEQGFVDDTSYQYADMAAAVQPNDGFRRLLVTKTIHIRNSRA
jgi:type IV pilus assembly protein PilW